VWSDNKESKKKLTIKSKKNCNAGSKINFFRDKKSYFYNQEFSASEFATTTQDIMTNEVAKYNKNEIVKYSNHQLKDYDVDAHYVTSQAYTLSQKPIYLHKKGVKTFQLAKEEGIINSI
jgi:hypothetical protein